MKKLKGLLITLVLIRWGWLGMAELFPDILEYIREACAEICASPLGDRFAGLRLLELAPWLSPAASWVWSAAVWKIPLVLVAVKALEKYLPAMKIAACKFVDFLRRLYPKATPQEHMVLRIMSPDRTGEEAVDIIEDKTRWISDNCVVSFDGGRVYKSDENGTAPMETDKWYDSSDGHKLRLVGVRV